MALKRKEAPTQRVRVDVELDRLEQGIAELKIQYEQFFLGVRPHPPTKHDQELERLIRDLQKATVSQVANKFRLNTLKQRLQSFRCRWERVMRERDEGTFAPDVFKAKLRSDKGKPAQSKKSAASNELKKLYDRYCEFLSKAGKEDSIPTIDAFKKVVTREAKRVQDETGQKRVSFKISLIDGQPQITAK